MRKVVSLIAGVLLVLIAGCSGGEPDTTKKPKGNPRPHEWGNKPAPKTEGLDVDGRPLKLDDHKGKVVLVDFWATWCGPCRMIIPHEMELVRSLKDRPFAVLGVSADNDRQTLRLFQEGEALNFRSIFDGPSGPNAIAWGVEVFPTLFLVDHEGVIRYRFKGVGPTFKEDLDAAIEELLEKVP
jgi:thiol-disulfide isomerase/thioredoxin